MTSTRREFLGAALTVLAWLGLGKAVPKALATTDFSSEGEIEFDSMDGVIDFELEARPEGEVAQLG